MATVRDIATDVARRFADEVDRDARFPGETIEALQRAGVLADGVPLALGGGGLGLCGLAAQCATLARACGASAMVLAMHHIQIACIVRHGHGSAFFDGYLRELAARRYLLASMTSEVGTRGEIRASVCALERAGGRFTLVKEATTGSYCARADGILVTCRRSVEAPPNEQALVLVRRGDYTLTQTTTWDTLGMRGTCSPGFHLASAAPDAQILTEAFAECAAQTMLPYSHVLWSALWYGIAADAVARAAAFVRLAARNPADAAAPAAMRVARASSQLQALRADWVSLAHELDAVGDRPEDMRGLQSMSWTVRLNNLKLAASEAAPRIIHECLLAIGVAGYRNDSPHSVGRHYRDSLSAALMVSNDRIAASNAAMLSLLKDPTDVDGIGV